MLCTWIIDKRAHFYHADDSQIAKVKQAKPDKNIVRSHFAFSVDATWRDVTLSVASASSVRRTSSTACMTWASACRVSSSVCKTSSSPCLKVSSPSMIILRSCLIVSTHFRKLSSFSIACIINCSKPEWIVKTAKRANELFLNKQNPFEIYMLEEQNI